MSLSSLRSFIESRSPTLYRRNAINNFGSEHRSLFKQRGAFLYPARFEGVVRLRKPDGPTDYRHATHRLGKNEALRRLKASFSDAQSSSASLFVFKNQWSGDHLDFRASLLGQSTTGSVDVGEDHVRLEVQLPWLLSMLANKAKALVERRGKLMLQKPTKPSNTRN